MNSFNLSGGSPLKRRRFSEGAKKALIWVSIAFTLLFAFLLLFAMVAAFVDRRLLAGLSYRDRVLLRAMHPLAAREVGAQALAATQPRQGQDVVPPLEGPERDTIPSDVAQAPAPSSTKGDGANAAV